VSGFIVAMFILLKDRRALLLGYFTHLQRVKEEDLLEKLEMQREIAASNVLL